MNVKNQAGQAFAPQQLVLKVRSKKEKFFQALDVTVGGLRITEAIPLQIRITLELPFEVLASGTIGMNAHRHLIFY